MFCILYIIYCDAYSIITSPIKQDCINYMADSGFRIRTGGRFTFDLGRFQYHLQRFKTMWGSYHSTWRSRIGHTFEDVDDVYNVLLSLRRMENEINRGRHYDRLPHSLTAFSRQFYKLFYKVYASWLHDCISSIRRGITTFRERDILLFLEMHCHVTVLDKLIRYDMMDLHLT